MDEPNRPGGALGTGCTQHLIPGGRCTAFAIMSRVFYYAEGHGLWEEGKRSPASKAKLGKKHHKYERRILSFDETARVLARLEEPNLLVIETCIATGARI